MTVVSSFTAADLDPTRLKARGALMLRDFLMYAAQGGAQPAGQTQPRPESSDEVEEAAAEVAPRVHLDPLVADLAFRLRSEGLVVHTGYGTSAQRIDLAVEDPQRRGRVLVAVETDGLRYAAMASTRDRDRLRVEQLRRLGWEHVRVWSTDLFRDPARDVARVAAAVRAASAARPVTTRRAGTRSSDIELPDAKPAEAEAEAAAEVAAKPAEAKPADGKARVARGSKPEQSRDDTDAGWGEQANEDAQDQWLRDQRPPHWG
jgi:hypothetical protein